MVQKDFTRRVQELKESIRVCLGLVNLGPEWLVMNKEEYYFTVVGFTGEGEVC